VVGSQAFGGEGLSGTGPKAGGPSYLPRFRFSPPIVNHDVRGEAANMDEVRRALNVEGLPNPPCLGSTALPGPTGESNRLSVYGRGTVLCLGPGAEAAREQATIALANGCYAVAVAPGLGLAEGINGQLDPAALTDLAGIDLVAFWGDEAASRTLRRALAARKGRLIGLASGHDLAERCRLERHVCIDTTAAGGNASLLAAVAG